MGSSRRGMITWVGGKLKDDVYATGGKAEGVSAIIFHPESLGAERPGKGVSVPVTLQATPGRAHPHGIPYRNRA